LDATKAKIVSMSAVKEFKLSDLVLYKFICKVCDKPARDFVLRDRNNEGVLRRDKCRSCMRDKFIFHDNPNLASFPCKNRPNIYDLFSIVDIFVMISRYCGRFVTIMCVCKTWMYLQKWMVGQKLIPKYYYTDAQAEYGEAHDSNNDEDFDNEENSLECNVLRFIELPVDFFRVYDDIKDITMNECTCEDYKIKIDFIYALGPPRFDIGCLVLDYYHPSELKSLIHLIPWCDNSQVANSSKVFYCYLNNVVDDYLIDNCHVPRSKVEDYKKMNLSKYDWFICSVSDLRDYSRQFWWYSERRFNNFARIAAMPYDDMMQHMIDDSNEHIWSEEEDDCVVEV